MLWRNVIPCEGKCICDQQWLTLVMMGLCTFNMLHTPSQIGDLLPNAVTALQYENDFPFQGCAWLCAQGMFSLASLSMGLQIVDAAGACGAFTASSSFISVYNCWLARKYEIMTWVNGMWPVTSIRSSYISCFISPLVGISVALSSQAASFQPITDCFHFPHRLPQVARNANTAFHFRP